MIKVKKKKKCTLNKFIIQNIRSKYKYLLHYSIHLTIRFRWHDNKGGKACRNNGVIWKVRGLIHS